MEESFLAFHLSPIITPSPILVSFFHPTRLPVFVLMAFHLDVPGNPRCRRPVTTKENFWNFWGSEKVDGRAAGDRRNHFQPITVVFIEKLKARERILGFVHGGWRTEDKRSFYHHDKARSGNYPGRVVSTNIGKTRGTPSLSSLE